MRLFTTLIGLLASAGAAFAQTAPLEVSFSTADDGTIVGARLGGSSSASQLSLKSETIRSLSRLSDLRRLSASATSIDDTTVVHLTNLRQLEGLVLSFTNVTDASFKTLATMPNLKSLRLEGCKVTDEHFEDLTKLTNLSNLYLAKTKITDKALSSISKFKNLVLLDLSDCEISDAGLASMGKLPQIQHLWLSKTIRNGKDDKSRLTDRSVKYLSSLNTLVDLQIADSQLTQDGLSRLASALPKTEIDTKSSGVTYVNAK